MAAVVTALATPGDPIPKNVEQPQCRKADSTETHLVRNVKRRQGDRRHAAVPLPSSTNLSDGLQVTIDDVAKIMEQKRTVRPMPDGA